MSEFVRAESKTPMRVGELIRALQQCNPDALVFTEGCDCYGDVGSVVEDEARSFWNRDKWDKGPGVDLKRLKPVYDDEPQDESAEALRKEAQS